jgi:hypothetical protein
MIYWHIYPVTPITSTKSSGGSNFNWGSYPVAVFREDGDRPKNLRLDFRSYREKIRALIEDCDKADAKRRELLKERRAKRQ